jgi:hypothetical protein
MPFIRDESALAPPVNGLRIFADRDLIFYKEAKWMPLFTLLLFRVLGIKGFIGGRRKAFRLRPTAP